MPRPYPLIEPRRKEWNWDRAETSITSQSLFSEPEKGALAGELKTGGGGRNPGQGRYR